MLISFCWISNGDNENVIGCFVGLNISNIHTNLIGKHQLDINGNFQLATLNIFNFPTKTQRYNKYFF